MSDDGELTVSQTFDMDGHTGEIEVTMQGEYEDVVTLAHEVIDEAREAYSNE